MILHLKTKIIRGVGTFGELSHNGELVCVTVERDWQNNQKSVSCVPAGRYQLIPHDSPKFKRCLALENWNLGVSVHGQSQRTHCLFHAGNHPSDLQGCIAPGLDWSVNGWGVSQSRDALNKLLELVGDTPAALIIERL